jgi:hypothetical protein
MPDRSLLNALVTVDGRAFAFAADAADPSVLASLFAAWLATVHAPSFGARLPVPGTQAAPQASAAAPDPLPSRPAPAGPTAASPAGVDGRTAAAHARRTSAELAVLAVLADERGPVQFGQVAKSAVAGGLALAAAEKAINRLVDLGQATKSGARSACPVTITEAGRQRHRDRDRDARPAFAAAARATCCAVLNDGGFHLLADLVVKAGVSPEIARDTLDALIAEGLVGVSTQGPDRRYRRRGAQAIA